MKIVIQKLTDDQIRLLGIKQWPVWTKEISEFDWFYDEREQCYLLEGQVRVDTEFASVEFGKGDFVTFPKGLQCKWRISQAVRKHYNFG
ncbi:MAG: cupin domain-containing protein [Candidatus Kapabacteria bacterium]|nr:cupin domain-containing protein [Candidatus Kapabacteria bacterium]